MEKQKRCNKEKKLEDNNFRLKIGTINKNNPQAIYIKGETFVTPTIDENIKNNIKSIEFNFIKKLKEEITLNKNFDNTIICDFNVRVDRMKKDKKSLLRFEYYLSNIFEKDFNKIINNSNNIIENSLNTLKNELLLKDFNISKTKN